MRFSDLPPITHGKLLQLASDRDVGRLITDSRKAVISEEGVFFAIRGERHNGHDFIRTLYEQGIHQFVVEVPFELKNYPEANVLLVDSAVGALQQIAAAHRRQFDIPVVGITGSNGKTIVKEWLYQVLSPEYVIVKNPGSYNSQIGVPLSVWEIQPWHQLGIFEAGISQPNEMEKLREIIQPDYGIFTNIGSAHDAGFKNRQEKISEKLKLFKHVKRLIYCADHADIRQAVVQQQIPVFSWGKSAEADLRLAVSQKENFLVFGGKHIPVHFPFDDAASIENAMHCIAMMLVLNYPPETAAERMSRLKSVPMRLEVKDGINSCVLIDDSYNNDLAGLQMSLDFLQHQRQRSLRTVILSDMEQSGVADEVLVKEIASKIHRAEVGKFIGIGPVLRRFSHFFSVPAQFYLSTEEFLQQYPSDQFSNEVILIKGARVFRFERISAWLQRKVHGTILEINASALVHNLNYFRSHLKPGTRMMAMVKAFAYGNHSVQVANLLQYHRIDYLGVAYADEGAELRQHHITVPIMVMNPAEESFDLLLGHQLEPEIYSLELLEKLIRFLNGRKMGVHIKLDTGMHRLGFVNEDLKQLSTLLKSHPHIQVKSIFSHLSGADDPSLDELTHQQAKRFTVMAGAISSVCHTPPLLHLVNTSGILRFPQYHFDMVRLGIGLYGVDPTRNHALQPVATLKTTVSQVRQVKAGESVGYSGRGVARHDRTIATLAIGYADGFSRAFGNGVGAVLINGRRAPVVGNVCMDMTMVDVSGLEVKEGDTAIVFGEGLPIEEVANRIGTIPYEILTNTSARVKRVMVAEGI
ncbi:MAG: bifunctional UDP-N-acetylmuramoyl-tripeptide:D-alanyl-D-alanine ligase/alanine racemase [Cyclobacteriaceae bacterium]|nr:bifunctional UDP-N-acetylmuramoyl-tripeptide:D-alanyl-D-alanine ligase/alanine racemase [Cyclobacteriaceae bacterium]